MSPKFHLKVAHLLYLLLHVLEKSLELLNISKLFIDVLHLITFLLYVRLYDILIPEDGKLLLYRRSFLVRDLELMQCSMDVLHG
jgi:hypothetical protein